jgi:hypothetical protein
MPTLFLMVVAALMGFTDGYVGIPCRRLVLRLAVPVPELPFEAPFGLPNPSHRATSDTDLFILLWSHGPLATPQSSASGAFGFGSLGPLQFALCVGGLPIFTMRPDCCLAAQCASSNGH